MHQHACQGNCINADRSEWGEMALHWRSGISVESWVEMDQRTTTRCEVDVLNDSATLFFGEREDFVLHLGRENLRSVAELAAGAHAQLVAAADL